MMVITNLLIVDGSIKIFKISIKRKDNKSGFPGVSKKGDKFQADISINKQKHYLGLFDTPEEAFVVYNSAKTKRDLQYFNNFNKK